ncbi:MAG: acylneuraminate cytidylyltransferase family protein, partial [Spirochaetes bacterium]
MLAVIPARGGSKGLPRKNLRLLADKPLIVYSIEAALKSEYINRIVISTEDEEIAKIAKKYEIEVIRRPVDLAKDDTPMIDVVLHVLNSMESEYTPNIVILLQP